MDKLLQEYREKFDDQFPLMACRGMAENEIIDAIKECLGSGKPYELDPGVFY